MNKTSLIYFLYILYHIIFKKSSKIKAKIPCTISYSLGSACATLDHLPPSDIYKEFKDYFMFIRYLIGASQSINIVRLISIIIIILYKSPIQYTLLSSQEHAYACICPHKELPPVLYFPYGNQFICPNFYTGTAA